MKHAIALFAVVTAVIGCSGPPTPEETADPPRLRVALLPDEHASTIISNNQKLKEYLERQLGKEIELIVTSDYSSMIEAMAHGRLELAYFGPFAYVLAKQKSQIEPFAVQRAHGSTTYQAVIIGSTALGINAIDDLKGKEFAFGDPASTSSHLIPKAMLAERGLKSGVDYRENFLGAHDAVALAVQHDKAAGGGLSKPIFDSLVERGTIDKTKVRVLQESRPCPQYPWTMRTDLKPELKEKIRAAFFTLTDPDVLKPFKADGFSAVTDADYDVVRDLAKVLDVNPIK
jgi:phosphonate transport system substrate-binding protein